jgi:putative protease
MPYENSRRNLEATFEPALRERVLVPIFSYPALFRMRFKLPDDYNFTYFNDKEGSGFQVVSYDDGSFVMPEMPYSICDKTEFLSQSGFKKMLIDFSKTKLTKGIIKSIMTSILKQQTLPETSRFNWKNGFYSPQKIEEYKASNERAAAMRRTENQSTKKVNKTNFSKKKKR